VRLQYWLQGTIEPRQKIFFRLVELVMEKEFPTKAAHPNAQGPSPADEDTIEIHCWADKAR
jgi:hypothetical protein